MLNVYICHPFASDPAGNVNKVREICRNIANNSVKQMSISDKVTTDFGKGLSYSNIVVPVCPLLLFPEFMSEPEVSRFHAMEFCLSLLRACDEMWICSEVISSGMRQEIDFCKKNSIPISIWPYWQFSN